jgi:PAS domain S-box-containing protein
MFSSTGLGFEHLSQPAIDAIPAAVFLTTLPGGEILGANRCASEWCGRDVSSAGRLADLLHSTDGRSESVIVADDPIASALRDGSVLRDIDAFLDTASSAIRVAVSIEAVRNSSGQPCVAVTLCSRMARTMNAAVDSSTNRRRMDLVLKGAQLGTWELDLESRVLTSSPQCKANHGLGCDQDLQLESVILPAIDSEYRGAFRAAVEDAIASGAPFEMEVPHEWPDRSHHVLFVAGRVIDRSTMAGVSLDVTDRRHAEAQLRANERRYRDIVEMANEGIWTLDADARVTFVNRRMTELAGWPEAEMLGRHKWDFAFEEDVPAMKEFFERRRCGSPEAMENVRLRHRDGHAVWTLMAARPILDDTGRFTGALDLFTDITAGKHAEEALRDANRRKDEFLALLAHELRAPLAPILTAVRFLQLKGPANPELVKLRATIYRQTMQLSKLVDDLLDVARITSGTPLLTREVVDISVAVSQALEACDPTIQQHHHRVEVSLPPGPVDVEIDVGRMAQVLCNLLTNAAKYMDRGGRIDLSVTTEAGMVVIAVRDRGIGIDPAMQARIFDRFVQVDRASRHGEGGLGLGLALVKTITEMHGGTVAVHSDGLGRGSEFTVRLPVAAARRA